MNFKRQIRTYGPTIGGEDPKSDHRLLVRIVHEMVPLLPAEDMPWGSDRSLIDSMVDEQLKMAIEAVLGRTAIGVTTNPWLWSEIFEKGPKHILFEGWNEISEDVRNWGENERSRFLWHNESGLVVAQKLKWPEIVDAYANVSGIRVFPWTRRSLVSRIPL